MEIKEKESWCYNHKGYLPKDCFDTQYGKISIWCRACCGISCEPPTIFTCPTCTEQFIPKDATQIFCKRECVKVSSKRNSHTLVSTKVCLNCDDRFLPKQADQKYCSTGCAKQRNIGPSKALNGKQRLRVCFSCGLDFTPKPKQVSQIHCSRSCARKYYYKRHPDDEQYKLDRLRWIEHIETEEYWRDEFQVSLEDAVRFERDKICIA